MKKVLIAFFLLNSLAQASNAIVDVLGAAKLKKSSGKVYLSGRYQASGRFKCDENFLTEGRIYFTLGSEDYSYTLSEVLGNPDLLRMNNLPVVRDLASQKADDAWELSSAPYLEGKRITLVPKEKNSPIKKINIDINESQLLQSIYLDFGSYNLAFFAS